MITLLLATFLSFISVHSALLGKQILKFLNKPSSEEQQLLEEKKILQYEQNQISITENFAKYSKIQRKINIIDVKLNDLRNERNNITQQLIVTYGLKVVIGVIILISSIYYRNTPVFDIDDQISLIPFDHIISYPNGKNTVSFHFWIICCSTVMRLVQI